MGYMGFGLQKWIYTQKPRKAFENKSVYSSPGKNPETIKRTRQKVDAYFTDAKRKQKIALACLILIGLLLIMIGYSLL